MTNRLRSPHVAVNFDGLTDAVTNLTGAIILLVVLVLGITTEVQPTPAGRAATGENGPDRSIEPLLQRAQAIRLATRTIDEGLRQLEQGLPGLESRLESLRRKADKVVVGPPGSPAVASTSVTAEAADPAAAAESSSTSLTVGEEVIAFLEETLGQCRGGLDDLQRRMSVLEEKIRRLSEQAASLRPPDRQATPPAAPQPAAEVRYRPPLEQASDQQTLVFCCREGKIRFVDVARIDAAAVQRRAMEIARSKKLAGGGAEAFEFRVPAGEFRYEAIAEKPPGGAGPVVRWWAVLEPGLADGGEVVAGIEQANSRFRRVLAAHPPGRWCVNFAVWPDSYEAFRTARQAAWNAGYDVGWHPMESGEPLRLTPGESLID